MKLTLITLLISLFTLPVFAEDKPAASTETVTDSLSPVQLAAKNAQRLLTSLRDGRRKIFMENASAEFQEAMSTQAFNDARSKLLPILQVEANLDYLGSLNKGTSTLYLYRLRPLEGKVDSLVTLAMQGRTVTGFFVN